MSTNTTEGIRIDEVGGNRHPSLEAAHQASMPVLAQLLANTIQAGLDSGRYVVENGVVKLSKEGGTHEQMSSNARLPRLGILP